jgi:hypothetical protein
MSSGDGQSRTFMIAVGALVAVFLVGLIALVALVSLTQGGRRTARETEIAQINVANTSAAATGTAFAVEADVQATLNAVAAQASPTSPLVLPDATETPDPAAPAEGDSPSSAASPTMVVVENTATTAPTITETLSPAEALSGDPAARTATVEFLLTLSAGGGGATAIPSGGDAAQPGTTVIVQSEAMTATAYAYQATVSGVTTTLPNTGFWDEVGIPVLLGAAALFVVIIFVVRRLRLSE